MAGFFGFGNYAKEGKGVSKNEPKKRSLFAFFELFFRKFWRLVKLNLLYLLACIPTFIVMFFVSGFVSAMLINQVEVPQDMASFLVGADLIIRIYVSLLFTVLWGMGPVTCGFTYILRNYAREEHAWIFSDFWQHTFSNLKQSIALFLIDVVAFTSIIFAYNFYGLQENALNYVRYIILGLAFIYTLAHFYIYPLMITFKLSLKNILRNSFLLAIAKLPLNLLTLIIVAFIHIVIPYIGIVCGSSPVIFLIVFVVLEIFILISLTGFVINFSVYPVIKENLLAKADPEKYGEKTSDNTEDTVFSDNRL